MPWGPQFDEADEIDIEKKLETVIFQGLGAASICWQSMEKTGVFDSTLAKEIGDYLVNFVREEYSKARGAIY